MKTSVSWKSFLLLAHALLLIGAIACGRWLYAGALGRSDALTVFNPYPLVTIADLVAYCPVNPYPNITPRSEHVVSNPIVYVRDWYHGLCGRLSTAVMNSLIAQAAKWMCPTPESFPWWLMRALSLYCLLATPLTFMAAVGWVWAGKPGRTLVLLAAVWALWFFSPKVYIFTVVFDVLLTDRIIHAYVLAWMLIGAITDWMGRSFWKWAVMAAGILFLGAEQTMFSAPIILLAAGWVGLESQPEAGRRWRRQVLFYAAWTCLAALMFFLSPGQRLRNTFLALRPPGDFAPLEWFRQVVASGYGALFPRVPDSLWVWHLILYAGLGITLAVWTLIRSRRIAGARDVRLQRLFGIALLAFAFLTAFLASMATLLVSPYFPPYAACYPSLLLVIGLALVFWLVLDGSAAGIDSLAASVAGARFPGMRRVIACGRIAWLAGLPLLAAGMAIAGVASRNAPIMAVEYRKVMEQNHNRRRLYAEIVRLRSKTGQRYFILTNVWRAPVWGAHMDETWAMAAYFRWRRMEDVVCLAADEWIAAGRPQSPASLELDCAKVLAGK